MSESEVLKEALARLIYDKTTGVLTWGSVGGNRTDRLGKIAGRIEANGYWYVKLKNKQYLAHRLIWLMTFGKWPDDTIDHINGICTDNRIDNLRDVTHSVNNKNRHRARKDSISGVIGVTKDGEFWRPYVYENGRKKLVGGGGFKSLDSAHKARIQYLEQLNGD